MNGSPWYMAVDFGTDAETRNPADYFAEAVENDVNIGDVVIMRGQDQRMTVEDVCACGSIDVCWFSGNVDSGWLFHRDTFDRDMLVNLDDEDDA